MKMKNDTSITNGSEREPRRDRRLFSVEDVSWYFDANPNRLINYVDGGMSRRGSVLSIHIAQLAKIADVPLKVGGKKCRLSPPVDFVKPEHFDNVDLILRAAREKFPASAFN